MQQGRCKRGSEGRNYVGGEDAADSVQWGFASWSIVNSWRLQEVDASSLNARESETPGNDFQDLWALIWISLEV